MKDSPILSPAINAVCSRFGTSDEGITHVINLAVLVATADGKIDSVELDALAQSLEALVGTRLAPNVVRHLLRESKQQIQANGVDATARAIGEALGSHGAMDEGLRFALAIAWASDGFSDEERARIEKVGAAAGVTAARVEELSLGVKPAKL